MAKDQDVNEYMGQLPADRRAVMEQLRSTIRAASPTATEAISYNMPAFRLGGRFLVSYEAYKRHYSLFPWSETMLEELGDALRPYAVGKGTIRFPADEPVPLDLIIAIVDVRNREVAGGAVARVNSRTLGATVLALSALALSGCAVSSPPASERCRPADAACTRAVPT